MIIDIIAGIGAALFAFADDYEYDNNCGSQDEFKIDTRVVDIARYHYDLETKGQSYVDIARENGLYSYTL